MIQIIDKSHGRDEEMGCVDNVVGGAAVAAAAQYSN